MEAVVGVALAAIFALNLAMWRSVDGQLRDLRAEVNELRVEVAELRGRFDEHLALHHDSA